MERLKVEYIGIDKVYLNDENVNIHSQKSILKIAKSIKNFGFLVPLVVDKNGIVIAGNGRLEAARLLKLKEVPIVRAEHLSEEQLKAFAIADNRIQEESFFDENLLAEVIKELELANFDLELTGLDEDEINSLLDQIESVEANLEGEKEEEIPEIKENQVIKRGDLIELGEHRLLCGDSTQKEDFQRVLQGEKIDLVFTDPPYGVNYDDKNDFLNKYDKGNTVQKEIKNDSISKEELKEFLLKVFTNIRENLNVYNSFYITISSGDEFIPTLEAIEESGLEFKHLLIWNKNNAVLGRGDYNYKHEPIIYGWAGKHKFYGNGEFKTTIWDIPKPQKNDLHPTMKPIQLIENAIRNSSKREQIVFDAFLGSGTTLIACENTKRKARGIELDPKYCQIIIERYLQHTGEKEIKINGNTVIWEEYKTEKGEKDG